MSKVGYRPTDMVRLRRLLSATNMKFLENKLLVNTVGPRIIKTYITIMLCVRALGLGLLFRFLQCIIVWSTLA